MKIDFIEWVFASAIVFLCGHIIVSFVLMSPVWPLVSMASRVWLIVSMFIGASALSAARGDA
jgi:hypothetical protein